MFPRFKDPELIHLRVTRAEGRLRKTKKGHLRVIKHTETVFSITQIRLFLLTSEESVALYLILLPTKILQIQNLCYYVFD